MELRFAFGPTVWGLSTDFISWHVAIEISGWTRSTQTCGTGSGRQYSPLVSNGFKSSKLLLIKALQRPRLDVKSGPVGTMMQPTYPQRWLTWIVYRKLGQFEVAWFVNWRSVRHSTVRFFNSTRQLLNWVPWLRQPLLWMMIKSLDRSGSTGSLRKPMMILLALIKSHRSWKDCTQGKLPDKVVLWWKLRTLGASSGDLKWLPVHMIYLDFMMTFGCPGPIRVNNRWLEWDMCPFLTPEKHKHSLRTRWFRKFLLSALHAMKITINTATCRGSSEILQAFLPCVSARWDEMCLEQVEAWLSCHLSTHCGRGAQELRSLPIPDVNLRMKLPSMPPKMGS